MINSEEEIKTALKEWVLKKGRGTEKQSIDFSTPLLEQGILSSLQLMDFILYIEKLKGAPLPTKNLLAATFSSINEIYRQFFDAPR